MSENNYTIAESFTLPSNGKIYEYEVSPEVTLRSMTTNEEMRRLASTDSQLKGMCDIIDACMTEDIGISSYDMCIGDYLFLLYKLRIVTYGNEYKVTTVCPICGYAKETVVDLDKLEVKDYYELVEETSTFTLPKSEREVTLKLQTPRILDLISKKVKEENKRKNKDLNEDLTFLYTLYYTIDKVDGKKPNPLDLEKWIRNLPLMDANIIRNKIEKLNNLIGLEFYVDTTCDICSNEYNNPFRISNEFFSPTVDD